MGVESHGVDMAVQNAQKTSFRQAYYTISIAAIPLLPAKLTVDAR
jgi:hypothetical protein